MVCPMTLNTSASAWEEAQLEGAALRLQPRNNAGFMNAVNKTPSDDGFLFWGRASSAEATAALHYLRENEPDALSRIVYEPCEPPLWIERTATPCRILKWERDASCAVDSSCPAKVTFTTPPWQGAIYLSAAV
jgi:hypothetical protein